MSPFGQSTRKGQESGPDTTNEHKRTKPIRDHTKVGRETYAPTGSCSHSRSERSACKTVVDELSSRRGTRIGLEAAWKTEQQSFFRRDQSKGIRAAKKKVHRFWANLGL